jgi:hypothetical protein
VIKFEKLKSIIMKEGGGYWKNYEEQKEFKSNNFTLDTFIQAMHIVASYGFDKMKDDLATRVSMLYKHIYEVMNRQLSSSATQNKSKIKVLNSREQNKRLVKDGSEIYMMSNRSGASTRSSKGRRQSQQNRRSKKHRSSNKRRSRRYAQDRYTPGWISSSFTKPHMNDSKNSLPALSAIYGNSFDTKKFCRRNNSGLAGIDLSSSKRQKGANNQKVSHTLDVKMYEKNNSLSLVVPSRIVQELKESVSSK